VQETCARLMNDLSLLLESPSFVPISVGVACDPLTHIITVTHSGKDIEKAALDLLQQVC